VCVYTLVASNKERTKIRPSHMHGKSYSSSAKGISMQLHIFSIHNITEGIRKKNMNKPHNPLTHHHISLFISFFFSVEDLCAFFLI
jgi:hypothetical protein